jgi:hypothetical protein
MHPTECWRPLFVGRCNGTAVQFICFSTGDYAVVQQEQILLRGTGAGDLPAVLDRFLAMIERPATPQAPDSPVPTLAKRPMLCAG